MRLAVVAAVIALSAVTACYPDQLNSVPELASITTVVDSSGTALKTARTFSLIDTVMHAKRAQGANVIGHANDSQILQEIRNGFLADGWREITNPGQQRPDVVVLCVVFEQVNTGVFYGSSWWGDFGYWPGWPAYGPDWAWGYPAGGVQFDYITGALAVVALDLRNGNPTVKRVPILWAGAVSGVVTLNAVQGTLDGIQQMFVQSPYLRR